MTKGYVSVLFTVNNYVTVGFSDTYEKNVSFFVDNRLFGTLYALPFRTGALSEVL